MYQMFGMDIVDSKEIAQEIESKMKIKIKEDITKGTQREDAIAYRAIVNIEDLGYEKNSEFLDEETMDILLEKSDEFIGGNLKELLPKTMDFTCFSNTYDPVTLEVNSIIVIMHISNAQRKLRDVLKRLLRI